VIGDKVAVWNEAEGLRSEMLRGVACSAAGLVYLAAADGVATFDGARWAYPRLLAQEANDIEIGADGRLWLATDRGLAVYDGARLRRVDARRGLAENRIYDLAIDQFGRVWARGSQSLGIVSPQ
jgi:ligand-binding sensor domain-containing protein